MCETDLFCQNKHNHQLFLQIFSHVFEKQYKIRSFESSVGCTKGCTFVSYGYYRQRFQIVLFNKGKNEYATLKLMDQVRLKNNVNKNGKIKHVE